jgi:hypothetical protein
MNTDEREQALLRLVQEERDKACRQVLAEADARARALKRDAYRRERAALHERIAAERQRAEGLLRAAAAERATAERRLGEQADARLIAAAWPALRAQLAERWANAGTRGQWVSTALAQARRRLPHSAWTIRHAAGWPQAERDTALAGLAADGTPAPILRADGDISAGLVIAAGGAMLDMSLEGLLRDRAQVEARLLALAKQGDPGAGPQPRGPGAAAPEEGTA